MSIHLGKNGFVPDYTIWYLHGEDGRAREEVLRQRTDDIDNYGTGIADMVEEYHEEEKEGREFTLLESWTRSQTKPDSTYCNPHVQSNLEEDIKVAIERNGLDFNPLTDPIDPDAIVIVGGGKKHDHHVILNCTVEPSTSISQIRAAGTSGSPSISPHTQPVTALLTQLEAEVAQLKEESHGIQNRMDELSRKMAEREANGVALRN